MGIWDILGIQPTEDISLIKKAYAQKLKTYHPEDDPEGFQKLREAFDNAKKYVENIKNQPYSMDVSDSTNNGVVPGLQPELVHYGSSTIDLQQESAKKTVSLEELNNQIIKGCENIYSDLASRLNEEKWKALFDSDILWDIKNKEHLSNSVLHFITGHHYLPQNIWRLLDQYFNWCEHAEYLYKNFPENFIRYVCQHINEPYPFSYIYSEELNTVDYEKYFMFRENALNDINNKKLDSAKGIIEKLKEIYSGDKEILRLEGNYYFQTNNLNNALSAFNHLLETNNNNTELLTYRAKTYYGLERFSEAAEDLQRLCIFSPDDTELHSLLGNCYLKMKDYSKAKECFLKVLESTPSDIPSKSGLIDVNNQLLQSLRSDKSKKDRKLLISNLQKEQKNLDKDLKKLEGKKQKSKLKFKFKSLINILLFLFLFAIIVSAIRYHNASTPLENSVIDPAPSQMENNGFVDTSTSRGDKIQLTFKNVKPLRVYTYTETNSNAGTDLKTISELDDNFVDKLNFIDGQIYVGELNNKVVIIYNTSQLKFNYASLDSLTAYVTINKAPPPELMSTLKSDISDQFDEQYLQEFDTSKYYVGEWEQNNKPKSFSSPIFKILRIAFYFSMIVMAAGAGNFISNIIKRIKNEMKN